MKRGTRTIPITERLAVLSEPLRLRAVRLLELQELSVGEVAKVLQLPQSTASRHLKVLSEGEWVTKRSVGPATYYRVTRDDLAPDARAVWSAVHEHLVDTIELAEDDSRLEGVLGERKLDSQAFFGRVAGEWDSVRSTLFGDRFTSTALLGLIRPDWVVADIGCGTGNASELLAPFAEKVIAVDQSEPMLGAAGKRLENADNIEFVSGKLSSLPIEDASVDAAVCLLVLHHVPEPILALREMRRVLRGGRGGGVALVVDMIEHDRDEFRQTMGHVHQGFGQEQLKQMWNDAGFEQSAYRILPGEPDAIGPGLFVSTGRIGT